MSNDPDRTPVLVAVGQAESRDLSLGPLELAEAASQEALRAAPGLAKAIQRVTVVNILSRRAGPSPATDLATTLRLDARVRDTTNVGGNSPQLMVERAARDIATGRLDATLIAGAEAVRAGRLEASKTRGDAGVAASGERPPPDAVVGIDRQDLSDEEHMAGFVIPVQVYPLFESVLAHRAGRDPAQQRQFIGQLMAPFTEVAARHPHAWFRQARSPAELATASPENRLVAEPYLKKMVAFLGGAQGAALVVASLSVARSLGLEDRAVFVWSSSTVHDVWNPMARPDLGRSAGLEAAARGAMTLAGVGRDDISLFDLYSCFPSAVQVAADALGLPGLPSSAVEPSRLTVTGGLPYFGGPGNNYTTHAIATMFDLLGASTASSSAHGPLGLVTAVGWYMTKHSTGIYGTTPPPRGFKAADNKLLQEDINATALPCVKAGEATSATATVEASTVMYDRDGRPIAAPVIATLEDGRRVAASASDGDIGAIAGRFLVGSRVSVEGAAGAPVAPRYRVVG
ncbi:MAG: acetyl-CoA acetyltransferase [Acidimicrobiales bacterium]